MNAAARFVFYAAEISVLLGQGAPGAALQGGALRREAPDRRGLPRGDRSAHGPRLHPDRHHARGRDLAGHERDPRRARGARARPAALPALAAAARASRCSSSSTPTSSWCCRRCTIAGAFPRARRRRARISQRARGTRNPRRASPAACTGASPRSACRRLRSRGSKRTWRELLARLDAHLASHAYLLGSRMSLADCSLMGPFYAHLYLDAVPGRLLRERAPRVCHWIERMNHPDPAEPGEWLTEDELPETLAGAARTDRARRGARAARHPARLRGVGRCAPGRC